MQYVTLAYGSVAKGLHTYPEAESPRSADGIVPMTSLIECVVAGGPQHGAIFVHADDNRGEWPLSIKCSDGYACALAGRRSSRLATRLVFVHPDASGREFLSVLTAPANKTPNAPSPAPTSASLLEVEIHG